MIDTLQNPLGQYEIDPIQPVSIRRMCVADNEHVSRLER